jgi:tellurite resistance protein TerC
MMWIWVCCFAVLLLMVALDVGVFHRRAREREALESIGMALFWLAAAGALAGVVWFIHDIDWLGVHTKTGISPDAASLKFIAGFFTELALDLDTVFVVAAVFAALKIQPRHQHTVLTYGLLLSIPLRGGLVSAVGGLLSLADWVRFVFAGLLVLAALRMLVIRQENTDPNSNIFVKLMSKVIPPTKKAKRAEFVTRDDAGKLVITPLLVALVMIETADAFLALDAIPAVYASTTTPYIAFLSSGAALLCLRALFPVLKQIVGWIRYVKVALAFLLGYMAVLISLSPDQKPPTQVTIAVVASALVAGFGVAVARTKFSLPVPHINDATSPLGEDADRLARGTLKQARKLVVLVVGLTIVGLGVLALVGPGPGLIIIPIGLGLLATEFVWAKRLLSQYSKRAQAAGTQIAKRTPVWMVPLVIGGTIVGLILFVILFDAPLMYVIPGSVPLFIGQAVWAYLVFKRAKEPVHQPPTMPSAAEPNSYTEATEKTESADRTQESVLKNADTTEPTERSTPKR